MAASPRTRGTLARGYEGRFGTHMFADGGAASPRSPKAAAATPRSGRKQGLTTFTDPTNPFSRHVSKQITRPEDVRGDGSRAGVRTCNPGHMPSEPGSRERPRTSGDDVRTPNDGRSKLVVHCYGSQNWRPGKAVPNGSHKSPQSSDGVANLTTKSRPASAGYLENYLNDMKRCGHSLRSVPGTPSQSLQRMNDVMTQLPAQRRETRARSLSVDQSDRKARIGLVAGAESESEDNYGFTRKRSVDGRWTTRSSRLDILHHENGGESTPLVTPRSTRQTKAEKRFEEVTAHMKAKCAENKAEGHAIKASDRSTGGLLDNESFLKYPVD